MKKLFGTDGIRGQAGEFPLDDKTVETIGRSIAEHFRERAGRDPRFVTGRDTRESGEQIENALCRGIASAKGVCESAGVITTPGVAFVAREFGSDAGIVISASHNPFYDNGIKVFLPDGKKIDSGLEKAIEADVFNDGDRAEISAAGSANASRAGEFQDAYIDSLHAEFSGMDLSGMNVTVDCANGAASFLAPRLFERFGAAVTAINAEPDGRNINLNCGSTHIEELRAAVSEGKADIGAAFDGDADRALFVDENGETVDGDATLWIVGKYMAEHGGLKNGSIVATVMSNLGLELALRSRGIDLVRTAVGDKYVLDELLRSDSELGGEQSGHVIFPRVSLVGDGMRTALFVLRVMSETGKTLSELAEGFVRYPQTLVNVKVKEKLPFDEIPDVAAEIAAVERELDGTGRLLMRYSGTENLARVMIEGEDQAAIDEQAERIASAIRHAIGVQE